MPLKKPLKPVRDAVGRAMLFPALRLLRAQMKLISDPVHLRAMATRLDAFGSLEPDVRIEPVTAGSAPASWIDVKGVRKDRVVLYLHGGAFIAETPVFHGALLARICRESRARGLMLSYRLAPEHVYPAALDDCLAAYRWLLEQGFEASRIIVAGDSAGGNLTLALLLRARDEGLPLPAGAVALSPVADLTFSGDSVQRNDGIDDMFSADLMDALVPMYLPQRDLCTHPHVSPLFGDYADMPPLLLIVGSTELLLDDSVRVSQLCPNARLLVWDGMPHVFPGFAFLPEAREATRRIGQFVRECLAGEPEPQAAAEGDADSVAITRPTAPVAQRLLQRFGVEALLYFALVLVTGLLSLVLFAMWPGPALIVVNPVVLATTVVVVAFMLVEVGAVGWRRLAWSLAAALLLGPAFGLSLYLLVRALRARGALQESARAYRSSRPAGAARDAPEDARDSPQ
jgi:monoterpene epsilon-lactone hydrolase